MAFDSFADGPPQRPLRIAQVAPLFESVPPHQYGGTERVVSYLTEELVRQGHQVTLFASEDSRTSARLVVGAPRALRQDRTVTEPLAHEVALLEKVAQLAEQFDLVHFHCGYLQPYGSPVPPVYRRLLVKQRLQSRVIQVQRSATSSGR